MIPSVNAFQRLLTAFEDGLNRQGWGGANDPAARFVYGTQDGALTVSFPMRPPGGGSRIGTRAAFCDLALHIAEAPIPFPPIPRPERLAGLTFASEAWMNDDPDCYDKYPDAESLADIPGSYETRLVVAADTADRLHWLVRRRGRKPMMGLNNDAEPTKGLYLDGALNSALRLIVMCACERFLPADQYAIPDLAARKKWLVNELHALA